MARKSRAAKAEAVEAVETTEAVETVETAEATEAEAIATAKSRSKISKPTDKQKAAAAKRKEAAKIKAAKEKDETKRVETRTALAAVKVPAKDITAAKAALKRIEAAPLAVRADYLKVGQLFVDGKAFCLKDDGSVNQVVFGAWLDKIAFGNDVIDKSKRSNIIWMTEKQEVIAKNSDEVLALMGDEISPNRYRSFFRNLTIEQCADPLYTEMGFDAEGRSKVTPINGDPEGEGEGESEGKEAKAFDHEGFTNRTVATLMEKFEANTSELENFVSKVQGALKMINGITEETDEAETRAA